MATKELEKPETANVPDLVRTPALEIESQDVALPKLKLGQFTADAVKAQLVPAGSLYTTVGPDDPDPETLLAPAGRGAKDTSAAESGVKFYVLGMTKGWMYSEQGSSDFETWEWNDPSRHPDAWVTYRYTVAIPEVDEEVPYTLIMTKSAKPAAKQMNTVLAKSGRLPWHTAFEVRTKHKSKGSNEWFIPLITTVETDADEIKVAEKLAIMVAGQAAEFNSTGEEPAI